MAKFLLNRHFRPIRQILETLLTSTCLFTKNIVSDLGEISSNLPVMPKFPQIHKFCHLVKIVNVSSQVGLRFFFCVHMTQKEIFSAYLKSFLKYRMAFYGLNILNVTNCTKILQIPSNSRTDPKTLRNWSSRTVSARLRLADQNTSLENVLRRNLSAAFILFLKRRLIS